MTFTPASLSNPLDASPLPADGRVDVEAALEWLGVRRLVLGIHDLSFPSLDDEDGGRGTPFSEGGSRFLRFVRDLGFDAVQLGPPGQTTASNPSPYDGTLFSRNALAISLQGLVAEGLLPAETLMRVVAARPGGRDRVPQAHVFGAHRAALDEALSGFRARAQTEPGLSSELREFKRHHCWWLERDAVFEALAATHGTQEWRKWPGLDGRLYSASGDERDACDERIRELRRTQRDAIERYVVEQYLVHEQHRRLRERVATWGLKLLGDLQVGVGGRDLWALRPLFIEGYSLGAPPSRTNREGQPWGYAVLDPRGAYPHGAGRDFLASRVGKMLEEHDGLRIDHPHGMVCPWVYRSDEPDQLRAVQGGARLYSSPDLPDHPELVRLAIARADQVDRSLPRHADGWVTELDEEQMERYAWPLDVIVERALARDTSPGDLPCEVLSTWPNPLRRVMTRHGLGRFCVTQKVDPRDPHDLYRSERCRPEDWIMVGNHDTRPIWSLADQWHGTQEASVRATYLAERLVRDPERRTAFAERLERDPLRMVEAMFADLFVGPAENIYVFFTDLLGMKDAYNVPGSTDEANWSLRVPPDYESLYRERAGRGEALDLGRVLGLAIAARGAAPSSRSQSHA